MKADDLFTLARRNRLLSMLPPKEFKTLLADATAVDYPQGRLIYREESSIPFILFPVDAVASILVGAGDDSVVEVATVGNEGMVGVGAIMAVATAFGQTIIQIPGRAISLNYTRACRILREQPNVQILIHRYLYAFLRQVAQAGPCNRLHSAAERCARWLLMTQDRVFSDDLLLTQHFLAAMMGTRRPTVNLALATLRNGGAIEYTYRSIKILDRELLISFSCPCYGFVNKAFEAVRLNSSNPDIPDRYTRPSASKKPSGKHQVKGRRSRS